MNKQEETISGVTNLPVKDKATLMRLRRLSDFMDRSFTLPGGIKIGWDGIIGIVPGIGDLVGMAVSLYIFLGAMRLGASKSTLARMLGNIGIEAVVGAIPLLGDIFDLVFRANSRNMDILNKQFQSTDTIVKPSNRWVLIGVVIGFSAVALLMVYLIVLLFASLFGIIF